MDTSSKPTRRLRLILAIYTGLTSIIVMQTAFLGWNFFNDGYIDLSEYTFDPIIFALIIGYIAIGLTCSPEMSPILS